VLVFEGFYKAAGAGRNGDEPMLPPLTAGQRLAPVAVEPQQKFTSPPPRYTEASLVKALEADGIGRPSTYAAIIQTIQDRGYAEQEDRKFHPTHRGEIVTAKLVAHFPEIMDVRFTSHVEADLDKIEEQHLDWHDVLHEFYDPFKVALAKAHEEMGAVRAEPSEYACEACGKPMVYRLGKNGRFLSCSGYPDCKTTRDVDGSGKAIQPVQVDVKCEACGRPMILRRSKRGPFLGCSGYPECSTTRPCSDEGVPLTKVKPEEIKQNCPECRKPMAVKFARGRAFLGCSGYPSCKTTSPMPEGVYVEKPKPEQAGACCDKCGRPMVIRRSRRGPFLSCSGFPKCRNAMPMEKLDHLKGLEAAGQIPDAPTSANGKGASGAAKNGNGYGNGAGKARGKATRMTAEQVAALGAPPPGFAWTRTGRPVVDEWPEGELRCFACGGAMALRHGRFGPFFSCDKCKSVANLRGDAKKRAEAEAPARERVKPIETEIPCPECGAKMMLRMGKTGRFLGCSRYPGCRKTMEVPPGLLREVAEAAAT
jgi:ssDNA-binding Zn-finger/Zn-ribbon topoisomerase 1